MSLLEDIPETIKIVEDAIKNIERRYNRSLRDLLTESFSKVINEIEEEAERIYKEYEREAIKKYLERKNLINNKDVVEVIIRIIENSLVTSISNTRRARAGYTSQYILFKALNVMGIRCEISKIKYKGYRPDISVPNDAILKNDPNRGFAIAIKRTLRERWAEDIDIFKFPNSAFVLIKPDPDLINIADDMVKRGMRRVYVPDTLFEEHKEKLVKLKIFKRLSDLPKDLMNFLKRYKYNL